MSSTRWLVIVAAAAILAVAAPIASDAWARGGGGGRGGKGGGKRGGMGNAGNRGDYMEELQRELAEEDLGFFMDDATREPLHKLRFADRRLPSAWR